MRIQSSRQLLLSAVVAGGLAIAAAAPATACLLSKGNSFSANQAQGGLPGWLTQFDLPPQRATLLALLGVAAAGATGTVAWRALAARQGDRAVAASDLAAAEPFPIPVYLDETEAASCEPVDTSVS